MKENQILHYSCRNLTFLPELPNLLIYLGCSNNQLTSLPTLPDSLSVLYCYNNQLTSLPVLPNSLTVLSCCNNQLIDLPALPNSLSDFHSNQEFKKTAQPSCYNPLSKRTAVLKDNGEIVCGCFCGSIEKFIEAVLNKYDETHVYYKWASSFLKKKNKNLRIIQVFDVVFLDVKS